ncbi:oligopeptide/dipeptide ABC transporter ATP-binding protein [Inquilinus sp. CAU 1745]|uniref:ABC transporter ATP-binding protein n=1 Tax=Inquilinus sp. CAU 1745 TaxID=3140369 RepID=UPI00325B7286
MTDPILRLDGIVKHYPVGRALLPFQRRRLRAVDGVGLSVMPGETLAVVGESGCGKSTLARLMLRLIDPSDGRIFFEGEEITALTGRPLQRLRARMQLIFQDPYASLNPRLTVGQILEEPLAIHRIGARRQRRDKVAEMMRVVGLPVDHARRFPHEFSGGQRQRIAIARALVTGPSFVIGDEPVSALDVSIQAQIIELLEDLKRRMGLTMVFISHDLAVVSRIADRVAVMYLGQVIESGPTASVFASPLHPYTRALLAAAPKPDPAGRGQRALLEGDVPSAIDPPPGCRFHTRCPHATDICRVEIPMAEPGPDGHEIACHHWREIAAATTAPPVTATAHPRRQKRIAIFERQLARNQERDADIDRPGERDSRTTPSAARHPSSEKSTMGGRQ